MSDHVNDAVVGRTQSYLYTNILNVLWTNGGLHHCLCELRTQSEWRRRSKWTLPHVQCLWAQQNLSPELRAENLLWLSFIKRRKHKAYDWPTVKPTMGHLLKHKVIMDVLPWVVILHGIDKWWGGRLGLKAWYWNFGTSTEYVGESQMSFPGWTIISPSHSFPALCLPKNAVC